MSFNAEASKDFHTVAELAVIWRTTVQHIYNIVRRGDLPAYRIGDRIIVRRDEARKFLERNATKSMAA
jgi:excisionase family DNA binding protein